MIIDSLRLTSFRSWGDAAFDFSDGVTIISGQNGRGKTNILEAVYILSGARSWRAAQKGELVMHTMPAARVQAAVRSRTREFEIKLHIPYSGRSGATINGAPAGAHRPLGDCFRAVLFSPEDIQLVKGAPAGRRAFVDAAISQMRPRYGQLISRYNRVIMSKNRLLKDGGEHMNQVLEEYDIQLCSLGASIIGYRGSFSRGLSAEGGKVHAAISGGTEALTVKYRTVSSVRDSAAGEKQIYEWLWQHLQSHREAEKRNGTCLSGVHRDDLELEINGMAARAFASQGQARSAALALKFGEREMMFIDGGEYPVMLLDDVLSELDGARRDYVCRNALGGQSIITCCEAIDGFDGSKVIAV